MVQADDVDDDAAAVRTKQRLPTLNALVRKGPPIQGLIDFDDGNNGYGFGRGGACKARTLPHEQYCDVYYYSTDCDNNKALIRACPNGLVYTGNGRNGLIGVCDYPHRADCTGKDSRTIKERHSESPKLSEKFGGFFFGLSALFSASGVGASPQAQQQQQQEIVEQPDPCKTKSSVVGDARYCDRYWECEADEPILYDCPNGLVWVGKNRGIADGCDYPWRNPTLCRNKDLASKSLDCSLFSSSEDTHLGADGLAGHEEPEACWPDDDPGQSSPTHLVVDSVLDLTSSYNIYFAF